MLQEVASAHAETHVRVHVYTILNHVLKKHTMPPWMRMIRSFVPGNVSWLLETFSRAPDCSLIALIVAPDTQTCAYIHAPTLSRYDDFFQKSEAMQMNRCIQVQTQQILKVKHISVHVCVCVCLRARVLACLRARSSYQLCR